MGWNPRRFIFGALPPGLGWTLLLVVFLGWLSAMTAFPTFTAGLPAEAGGGCHYRLETHGDYKCVSQARYDDARAGQQRFATGILLGFFALQSGVALDARRRR